MAKDHNMRCFLFFGVVLTATLFSSCSQRYHCIKCLDGQNVKRDTLKIREVVEIPSIQYDTIVEVKNTTDTLILTGPERVKIKFRDLPGPTVYVSAECPPDSVIVEKKIPIETEVRVGLSPWLTGLLVVVALIVGALIVKIFG